jgi:nucleotide-binding universal stress UspA family protein
MYHRIMVPLDGSATAELGLREAIGLAEEQSARLHLLHVVDIPPMLIDMVVAVGSEDALEALRRHGREVLATAMSRLTELGIQADTSMPEITHGKVSDAIVAAARKEGCDLIVIGTHGRQGIKRLALGSDAERVARTSPVPVLMVRHDAPVD